ncbi:MAG: type II toxin-antitoxin system ParD family antitoxin, partial [Pseudomonadota bacterium]
FCYLLVLEFKFMNISLTPHFEELVKNKLASGHYHSASEVIRDALRLLEERDQLREIRLAELRKEIQKGIDSGEPTPWNAEEIKQAGRKLFEARKNEAF